MPLEFIDKLTPMSDDRMFCDYVEAILQDENVDCVFTASVPHSNALKSDPVSCHDSDSIANLLAALALKYFIVFSQLNQ